MLNVGEKMAAPHHPAMIYSRVQNSRVSLVTGNRGHRPCPMLRLVTLGRLWSRTAGLWMWARLMRGVGWLAVQGARVDAFMGAVIPRQCALM